jgi:hypothetical protein
MSLPLLLSACFHLVAYLVGCAVQERRQKLFHEAVVPARKEGKARERPIPHL